MAFHHGDRIDEMRKKKGREHALLGSVSSVKKVYVQIRLIFWACRFPRPVVGRGLGMRPTAGPVAFGAPKCRVGSTYKEQAICEERRRKYGLHSACLLTGIATPAWIEDGRQKARWRKGLQNTRQKAEW